MNVGNENQPSYDTVVAGVAMVGTSATALPGSAAGLFYLKAASGNLGTITLGGSGVTSGVGYVLAAGEVSPPIALTSLAKLYAIASQASQTLQYLGQV